MSDNKDKSVAHDSKNAQKDHRILVVDDEVALTGYFFELLTSRGYEVKTFNDPFEALQLFKNDPAYFDLVLTDQTMPGLTGAEMASEMLALRHNLPVILTTGYSDLVDEASAKALGIRAFLNKPTETQHLLITISDLLAQT